MRGSELANTVFHIQVLSHFLELFYVFFLQDIFCDFFTLIYFQRNKKLLNFVRIEMILQDILVDVLYDLLAQDIEQLRPRSICDISYLYSCHRKNNKHIPSIGWGKYVRDADKAIGDDIERIRDIKNEVQHSITRGIDERQYNRLCNDIVNLLKRFDQCIKPARLYTDRLNEMFAKTISVQEMETVCSIAEKRW